MARATHDLRDDEWIALVDAWGGCAYCASATSALQRDCVLPISRGGRYTLTNVVPACRACNASKCNTEVTVWLRRKRLDEAAFLGRWNAILAVLDQTVADVSDGSDLEVEGIGISAPKSMSPTL